MIFNVHENALESNNELLISNIGDEAALVTGDSQSFCFPSDIRIYKVP